MKTIVEILAFWILPLALVLEYQLWSSISWATFDFIFYVITVPALATYIIVATGAGWLKLWGFNLNYTIKNVPIQIGLIYSSVINILLLTFSELLSPPSSFTFTIITVILMSIFGAILGSLYDFFIVHYRILEVYIKPLYKGEKSIKIVSAYAPYSKPSAFTVTSTSALLFGGMVSIVSDNVNQPSRKFSSIPPPSG